MSMYNAALQSDYIYLGLVHGVIPMSGDDFSPWTMNQPEQDPEDYTRQVAWAVGCPTGNHDQMKTCMKNANAQDLADAWFDCTVGFNLSTYLKLLQSCSCTRNTILKLHQSLVSNMETKVSFEHLH